MIGSGRKMSDCGEVEMGLCMISVGIGLGLSHNYALIATVFEFLLVRRANSGKCGGRSPAGQLPENCSEGFANIQKLRLSET